VMFATYGGAGRTTSGVALIVNAGGLTSTVTDRDASAKPGAPAEPEAVTVAVMLSAPLGLPLTSNLQLVQGVAGGPVGVALTGVSDPILTRTLVMLSSARLRNMPGSPGKSCIKSHEAVPLTVKLPRTMVL
jgi:hypothetical protein